MAQQIRDLLAQRAAEGFVGREHEMGLLSRLLDGDAPLVTQLHGIAGVGKTTLLEAFSTQARLRGATVVRLDCRFFEPTERGFIGELAAAIGSIGLTTVETARRLGLVGSQVLLVLDTYEVFGLMDTWLRLVFLPGLVNERIKALTNNLQSQRAELERLRQENNTPDQPAETSDTKSG